MYAITYDLRAVAPVVTLETCRAPVQIEMLDQIKAMRDYAQENPEINSSRLQILVAQASRLDLDESEGETFEALHSILGEAENVLSDHGVYAYADGEANAFFIFEQRSKPDEGDFVIYEQEDGSYRWLDLSDHEWSSLTKHGAIVDVYLGHPVGSREVWVVGHNGVSEVVINFRAAQGELAGHPALVSTGGR